MAFSHLRSTVPVPVRYLCITDLFLRESIFYLRYLPAYLPICQRNEIVENNGTGTVSREFKSRYRYYVKMNFYRDFLCIKNPFASLENLSLIWPYYDSGPGLKEKNSGIIAGKASIFVRYLKRLPGGD